MPCAWDNCELAFVTVNTEILCRFVVCVQSADRDNLHTCTKNSITVKRLLQPELLQRHFAATFNLTFILTAFLFFYFYRRFRAAVLEFNLCSYTPAFAEIIS